MPEIRYYTVTQEREVKISAENVVDAAIMADAIFSDKVTLSDDIVSKCRVMAPVRIRDLVVREDY